MLLSDLILFEDAEAIVIDKPAGLPVDEPRSGGDSVSARLGELRLGFQRLPSPVHRLDRDTSGCLLLARNPKARARFAAAFERGEVEKVYIAVLNGELAEEDGLIDLPLAKVSSAEAGWRMVGDPHGQAASTRWKRIAADAGQTLVAFVPETGRTHQLRVHAAAGLNAPILGDPVYGAAGGPMLLHAAALKVPRQGKPDIRAVAPLPERFGYWADTYGVWDAA